MLLADSLKTHEGGFKPKRNKGPVSLADSLKTHEGGFKPKRNKGPVLLADSLKTHEGIGIGVYGYCTRSICTVEQ